MCTCVYTGGMFIPFYVGRVIDILGHQYQTNEFISAVLFMGLYSLGRYGTVFFFHSRPSARFCGSQHLTDPLFAFLISSVSAGCRGGLFLCAISAFTCRIKVKLFGTLTKQEIGFFETTKTGKVLLMQQWDPD